MTLNPLETTASSTMNFVIPIVLWIVVYEVLYLWQHLSLPLCFGTLAKKTISMASTTFGDNSHLRRVVRKMQSYTGKSHDVFLAS